MFATSKRYLTKSSIKRLQSTMENNVETSKMKDALKEIFLSGVEAVKPRAIIENKIKIQGDKLYVGNDGCTDLRSHVHMIGFGKAVMGMAVTMEEFLGHRLKKGIISIPKESIEKQPEKSQSFLEGMEKNSLTSGVVIYRPNCVHNQPDEETLRTSRDIVELVKTLGIDDTLIVLVSGGGSALLSMPSANISLDIKLDLCKKLQNSGADIKELNTIRQKLSMVKAGGLAKLAFPASVLGLILSDIIDDPIELIASGPTVYSSRDPNKVIDILKKYNIYQDLNGELKTLLTSVDSENETSSYLDEENKFKHVKNFVIANNLTAIEAVRSECLRKKLNPVVLFSNVEGTVEDISRIYCKLTNAICKAWGEQHSRIDFINSLQLDPSFANIDCSKATEIFSILEDSNNDGLILIAGGEPSIVVSGSGKGGRNQHLALKFSLDWSEESEKNPSLLNGFHVVFLSAGTDGQDGPTDAAGAFGYSKIIFDTQQKHEKSNKIFTGQMSPQEYLKNNDSYNFYANSNSGRDLFKTGFTGTNVMDIHLIYILKKNL